MSRITRSIIPAALAASALLALPAAGHAKSVTFGTRLDHEPANWSSGPQSCDQNAEDTDPIQSCTRVAVDKSDAVPAGLRAPATGTITKFRVRAGAPGTLTFRVAKLKGLNTFGNPGFAFGKNDGKGPTVHVQGIGSNEEGPTIESFPAHLKVKKGDYLAIDSSEASNLYCDGGGTKNLIFRPTLTNTFLHSTTDEGCDLLVQAVVKPAKVKHHHRRHHH